MWKQQNAYRIRERAETTLQTTRRCKLPRDDSTTPAKNSRPKSATGYLTSTALDPRCTTTAPMATSSLHGIGDTTAQGRHATVHVPHVVPTSPSTELPCRPKPAIISPSPRRPNTCQDRFYTPRASARVGGSSSDGEWGTPRDGHGGPPNNTIYASDRCARAGECARPRVCVTLCCSHDPPFHPFCQANTPRRAMAVGAASTTTSSTPRRTTTRARPSTTWRRKPSTPATRRMAAGTDTSRTGTATRLTKDTRAPRSTSRGRRATRSRPGRAIHNRTGLGRRAHPLATLHRRATPRPRIVWGRRSISMTTKMGHRRTTRRPRYLISKGADPSIRNNGGMTCYEGGR